MDEYHKKKFPNLAQLVDIMMSSSSAIHRVLVIDGMGNEIYTKATDKTLIREEHVQAFAKDADFIKKLLKLYDDMIGETVFAHLIRTKGQLLFFNYLNWTFCFSCTREASRYEIAEISDRMEKMIKNQIG